MRDKEFTKILGWPGYRVFRHEINETAKTLRLWVRHKRGNHKLICSGCGRKFTDARDYNEKQSCNGFELVQAASGMVRSFMSTWQGEQSK